MIFAIAEQEPGTVKFSVAVAGANAPSNLSVENVQHDENSAVVSDVSADVDGWVEDNGLWVGYASFTVTSGLSSFATVHRGGSPKILAACSYVAEERA